MTAEIVNLLGCDESEIIKVSAKTGENVDKVLDAIIERIPAPKKSDSNETRALIFDSYFDDYRGVILYVRMFDGNLPKNANIRMMATGSNDIALEVGVLNPKMSPRNELKDGEIGYIVTNLKATREAKVGDTVTLTKAPAKEALPGYKNVRPFVYAGFFPVSNDQYKDLKEALEKLSLSDYIIMHWYRFIIRAAVVIWFVWNKLSLIFLWGESHFKIQTERFRNELLELYRVKMGRVGFR